MAHNKTKTQRFFMGNFDPLQLRGAASLQRTAALATVKSPGRKNICVHRILQMLEWGLYA